MLDLNEFVKWQRSNPNSSVQIDISSKNNDTDVSIWVYDYSLMEGQYISDVSEINIGAAKEARDRELLSKLREKYGKGNE